MEAAELVTRMLGGYPSLKLHDPKTYAAEIVALLCRHPIRVSEDALIRARKMTEKYPPTITQVEKGINLAYLHHADAVQVNMLDEPVERRSRALPLSRWPPGYLGNVLVGPHTPQYAAMCERAKKAPEYEWVKDEHGIRVPFMWLK